VVGIDVSTPWEEHGVAPGGRIGGFVIEEQISSDGDPFNGVFALFRAHDEALGRVAALRVMNPRQRWQGNIEDEFLRDMRIIASVAEEEPHVLPVYASGRAVPSPPPDSPASPPFGEEVFTAAQFVTGTSLAALLESGDRPLRIDRALAIIDQVAAALDAAHAAGVVHWGVKPANILLSTFPGQSQRVYLTDFGLEKVRAGIEQAHRKALPTYRGQWPNLDYFAPEQILGEPVDARADQYGLACVAFHMLAGFAPFVRPERADTALGHVKGTLPSLPAYRRDLPFAIDDVFVRAMAKHAGDRYPSCGEFAASLRHLLR
jgi:serine/threonine-protein kinase